MLTDLLKAEFDPAVRKRGELIVSAGRVRRLSVGPGHIEAQVLGTDTYDVVIEVDTQGPRWDVLALCTCPAAADWGPCKHVWAVLLKAQGQALARWGPPPGRARLFVDEEAYAAAEDDRAGGEERGTAAVGSRAAEAARAAGLRTISEAGSPVFVFPGARRDGGHGAGRPPARAASRRPEWLRMLEQAPRERGARGAGGPAAPIGRLIYVLDLERSRHNGVMTIGLMAEPAAGSQARPKRVTIAPASVPLLSDPQDRAIGAMLVGAARPGREWAYGSGARAMTPSSLWQIDHTMFPLVVPRLLETGRFGWMASEPGPVEPIDWDERAWELSFVVERGRGKRAGAYVLRGGLVRGEEEEVPLGKFDAVFEGEPGLALRGGVLAPVRAAAPQGCMGWLKDQDGATVAPADVPALLAELHRRCMHAPVRWPAEWAIRERADVKPTPCLTVRASGRGAGRTGSSLLETVLSFRYGEHAAEHDRGLYLTAEGDGGAEAAIIRRCRESEWAAAARLEALGARVDPYLPGRCTLPAKRLGPVAAALVGEGWEVRGEQGAFRGAGAINIRVSSGIDWFAVDGEADFGGEKLPIAALLGALKRGERFVTLGDGSHGVLPQEWLDRHAGWMSFGAADGDGLRFSRAQLCLIDALLAEMPEASCDEQVEAARRKLAAFDGVAAREEPRECFRGELRPYQRLGLGWLHFLEEFGFGGCLADDMGLGKTVQVLAYLAERAAEASRDGAGPWLVVSPRSLVFNWVREAERFAPGLRVLDYTGPDRRGAEDGFAGRDLVVTTYGTLRSEIGALREVEFAGVILDEAQAIKNGQSQSAKAARLLKARRRLALTGTPVENSLDDLWSIFEFLNPGMLGSAATFASVARGARDRPEGQELAMLRRALKPFILRRTKRLVATELPERTEQTIACELSGRQRAIYDGLRKHYRDQLLGRIEREGLGKSRMHVLEALLRLRQAACHARLIEPKAAAKSASAKVDTLLEMLGEVAAEGNRALVFSQFTSLLDLVERELEARGLGYERLDGQTSAPERTRRVDRFQGAGGKPVFLISLKAGGVGLNLTAAQYVFLLDPWWNPAVEAQAIDRTHRIGQEAHVSAYRLIAKDTVEERILELQARKRELAEAIVSEQAGMLKALSREDLEWLLS